MKGSIIDEYENPTRVFDMSEIESMAENLRPVRGGRSASAFEALAAADSAQFEAACVQFEEQLVACTDAETLLAQWSAYVGYVEQRAALSRDAGRLFSLLERATSELTEHEVLLGDARLLALWLLRADFTDEPLEVYTHMEAAGVGKRDALFYERWALALEDRGMMAEAEDAYARGEVLFAAPADALRESHKHFQQRLFSFQRIEAASEELKSAQPPAPQRRTLGEISRREARSFVRPIARAVQMPHMAHTAAAHSNTQRDFAVFTDENNAPVAARHVYGAGSASKPMVAQAEARKENSQVPSAWNVAGALPQRRNLPARTPAPEPVLEIFEDETPTLVTPPTPSDAANTPTSKVGLQLR